MYFSCIFVTYIQCIQLPARGRETAGRTDVQTRCSRRDPRKNSLASRGKRLVSSPMVSKQAGKKNVHSRKHAPLKW